MALNEDPTTIKASGGDHATIDEWNLATDIDCVGGTTSPVGVCYDEDYAAAIVLDGATVNSSYHRRLTVADGEHHTGGFPKETAGAKVTQYLEINEDYFVLEKLIVEAGGSYSTFASVYISGGQDVVVRKLCVDVSTSGYSGITAVPGNSMNTLFNDCVSLTRRNHSGAKPLAGAYQDGVKFVNCVGWGKGALAVGTSSTEFVNSIVFCGGYAFNANCTGSNNISSDSSAPGSTSAESGTTTSHDTDYRCWDSGADFRVNVVVGMIATQGSNRSYVTEVASDGLSFLVNDPIYTSSGLAYGVYSDAWHSTSTAIFADTTDGAEDLRLKDGSTVADGNGLGPSADSDVSTTDIEGDSRSGATCDIGVDEYVVAGAGFVPYPYPLHRLTGGLAI